MFRLTEFVRTEETRFLLESIGFFLLLQPALDPGVAQEAQREEKVTQRDAAAAEEGSFVRTVRN
jgi:hypothetical protein